MPRPLAALLPPDWSSGLLVRAHTPPIVQLPLCPFRMDLPIRVYPGKIYVFPRTAIRMRLKWFFCFFLRRAAARNYLARCAPPWRSAMLLRSAWCEGASAWRGERHILHCDPGVRLSGYRAGTGRSPYRAPSMVH